MSAVPAWTGRDLAELLTLDATAPMQFVNRCGDANAHGRAYGGQILGQALRAAAHTVDPARPPTMMQFLFLQGTRWDEAIRFDVTALQDGKRFSSRHVRGIQGESRVVLDAQCTFAAAMSAPAHGVAAAFAADEDPESLPTLQDLPPAWGEGVERSLGYSFAVKQVLDFRLADVLPRMLLDKTTPRLRFWIRLRHGLAQDAALHAAAFAYLSDWWLNYPASGSHTGELAAGHGLYIASLNHALWLHRPLRADEWLHVDSVSPAAASGRGLSVARVHDRAGVLVASATQECLMAPRAD